MRQWPSWKRPGQRSIWDACTSDWSSVEPLTSLVRFLSSRVLLQFTEVTSTVNAEGQHWMGLLIKGYTVDPAAEDKVDY